MAKAIEGRRKKLTGGGGDHLPLNMARHWLGEALVNLKKAELLLDDHPQRALGIHEAMKIVNSEIDKLREAAR